MLGNSAISTLIIFAGTSLGPWFLRAKIELVLVTELLLMPPSPNTVHLRTLM
jgi:hypothetical protein